MPKARSRRDANLRRHLAYVAARMIAEDGVADYGAAKMKAARQEGLADANLLPDNQEIEEALREYQGLYQKEEQPAQLRRLREVAVQVMRELEAFRPVLVGSVLSGTAGLHSDVNLQLFTDDPKALAMFLLNKRYRVEEGSKRVRRGDRIRGSAADHPRGGRRHGHAHRARSRRRALRARAPRRGASRRFVRGWRKSRRCSRR